MAVTFDEAREIVLAELKREWKPVNGTLMVSLDGFEDARYWQVIAGPAEWLRDQDMNFEQFDVPAYLVNKETGKMTRLSVIENLERLGRMTAV